LQRVHTTAARQRARVRALLSHFPRCPLPQALAGAALGGIAYASLTPGAARPAPPPTETALTAALSDTTGRAWGLTTETPAPSPSSSPPARSLPPAPPARAGRWHTPKCVGGEEEV